ncbi:MAG: hypothetical protein QXK24_01250 [Ignisphaera sp.]
MARGTFRKIGLRVGQPFTEVRKIFGRQAADYAKKYLEEVINEVVPENLRELVMSDPGMAWLYTVKAVYKTFARLVKDKADKKELRVVDGQFNVSYDDVKGKIPADARAKIVSSLRELTATI